MFHMALQRATCMAFQNCEIKVIESVKARFRGKKYFRMKKNFLFAKRAREPDFNKTSSSNKKSNKYLML